LEHREQRRSQPGELPAKHFVDRRKVRQEGRGKSLWAVVGGENSTVLIKEERNEAMPATAKQALL
jgi:hypothetical protein